MINQNAVTFKATANNLIIIMKEDGDFESLYKQIEEKLESSGKFFKDVSIHVKYRGRKLTEEEEKRIIELMTSKTGINIKSFEEDTSDYSKNLEEERVIPSFKSMTSFLYFKGIDEGITKFYKGTVRSGQLVSFKGNVVVIGDVNPGGEIEAYGNVIVIGSLRGIVHAGADGNKEAIVVALNLQPTQLRIADVITRSPDEKETRNGYIPEIAYVKDGIIYIESFLSQHK